MTDNIKLPPMPEWLRLPPFRNDVQAYAREAVLLNAQATSMQWPKPEDVTPEMLNAFRSAYKEGDFWKARIHGALCAMLSAAPAVPQPAQQLPMPDGFVPQTCPHCNETWLMEAQQPLIAEKNAVLQQALEALENLQSKTHGGMNGEFRICCATRPDEFHEHCEAIAASEAIRTHLGVKND